MPENNPDSPSAAPRLHCAHDYNPPLPPKLPQAPAGTPGAQQRVFCCHCGAQGDFCLRVPKHGKHFPKARIRELPLEMVVLFDGHAEDEKWPCPGPGLMVV